MSLQQIIAEESRVVDHGFTLGALNEYYHLAVIANALRDELLSMETGHLRFVKGKGIVKTEEADCSLCLLDGLNDGRWHDPKTLTKPE